MNFKVNAPRLGSNFKLKQSCLNFLLSSVWSLVDLKAKPEIIRQMTHTHTRLWKHHRDTILPTGTACEDAQLETIHPVTKSSPDKEAVQIQAAPQKLIQNWMRGPAPNVPHRQVLIPDRDPSCRGGAAHAVGIQTLHQGQLRGVFQHRCSWKRKSNWCNGHFFLLFPLFPLSLRFLFPLSVSHPLFLLASVQQSSTHPLRWLWWLK